MSLAGYKSPTVSVEISGGSFLVKGLSPNSISTLVRANLPELEMVFTKLGDMSNGNIGAMSMESIVVTVADIAPSIISNIIALAAAEDAPLTELVEGANQMSIGAQIKAVTEIAELSFVEVGGVKKFIGLVMEKLKKLPASK
jgi:hypothetical protein